MHMSSQNSNRQQQRRGKGNKRFKKPKKEPPKKIDWKTYVPPGGKEWYEKNREKSIDNVNEEKRKLEVMVKIFGRKTPLELSYMQVEKL